MKVYATLTVCVDGVKTTREFDAEDEAIEAIGEAMWRKLRQPSAVVTLLVGDPTSVVTAKRA